MYDRRWYDSNEHTNRALELLKDMDGLPSDMGIIVNSLKNFSL